MLGIDREVIAKENHLREFVKENHLMGFIKENYPKGLPKKITL